MPGDSFELEATMSRAARQELSWLRRTLGTARVACPVREEDGDWRVELVKASGCRAWYFAPSLEGALAKARADVERTVAENRRRAA